MQIKEAEPTHLNSKEQTRRLTERWGQNQVIGVYTGKKLKKKKKKEEMRLKIQKPKNSRKEWSDNSERKAWKDGTNIKTS